MYVSNSSIAGDKRKFSDTTHLMNKSQQQKYIAAGMDKENQHKVSEYPISSNNMSRLSSQNMVRMMTFTFNYIITNFVISNI